MTEQLTNTTPSDPDADAVAANFQCGCFIRYFLRVNPDDQILVTGFRSNGCGYMIAAGYELSLLLDGKSLRDLHGLDSDELAEGVFAKLGDFPQEREQCFGVAIEALTRVFDVYRRKRIEEFIGEKALICTCFGVSEETIENIVHRGRLTDVEDVAKACNAGSGCGSCRMLIQEIIDSVET
ncbi:MAG TPA: (2Fe-2S)-binding protein [Pyrinomonadaceae bacterium]|nr:(2Fe-2S)-binding protein [Pyrinomonadaceae bacterium]